MTDARKRIAAAMEAMDGDDLDAAMVLMVTKDGSVTLAGAGEYDTLGKALAMALSQDAKLASKFFIAFHLLAATTARTLGAIRNLKSEGGHRYDA